MSNNDMVMVPRELIEDFLKYRSSVGFWIGPDLSPEVRLREILDRPAEQHQGEPAAWEAAERIANLSAVHEALELFSEDPTGDAGTSLVREVLNSASADPGEVERLRAELAGTIAESQRRRNCCADLIEERDALRSKLTEAQELLRMFAENSDDADVVQLSNQHLSDSAEPSAPAKPDLDDDPFFVQQAEPSAPVKIDDPMAPSYPEIPKHQMFVHVLILEAGENSYSEAVYGRDGYFRFGYDEPPIEDVEHWMNLPTREQARAALERKP